LKFVNRHASKVSGFGFRVHGLRSQILNFKCLSWSTARKHYVGFRVHGLRSQILNFKCLSWSTARKHYERQGLLVEEKALEQAEQECLADSEIRARRKEREQERRAERDEQYIQTFAQRVRDLCPNCPPNREQEIAEHACRKYTGRIGRSAAAKSFATEAIRLAVLAHIRHRETHYDTLLNQGIYRGEARARARDQVNAINDLWESG
jgi:hypothetical protein